MSKTIESLASHLGVDAGAIAKGGKAACVVSFRERGVSKHEVVRRVVYAHAQSDWAEARYIQWRGMWLELDGDGFAWL